MTPVNPKCPTCGGPMVSRVTKPTSGLMSAPRRFWGCADYPTCRGTRDTDGESRDERQREREDEESPRRQERRRWDR
jgi:ssDNA-binding Zn-finger/Zn-ribbon topoisomerase 1